MKSAPAGTGAPIWVSRYGGWPLVVLVATEIGCLSTTISQSYCLTSGQAVVMEVKVGFVHTYTGRFCS